MKELDSFQYPTNSNALEEYLRSLLNAVDAVVFTLALPQKTILDCNYKLCSQLGKPLEEVRGHFYQDIFFPGFVAHFEQLLEKCDHSKTITTEYYWNRHATWRQISLRKIRVKNHGDAVVVTISNTNDLRHSSYETGKLASYDVLLGLPNGRQLEKDVNAQNSFERMALVHFDIDKFNTVNQVYGWEAGDYVLGQIRDYLLQEEMGADRVYRAGEDEFALLYFDISLQAVQRRAEKLLARFRQSWRSAPKDWMQVYCNITMGVVYGTYLLGGETRNRMTRAMQSAGKGRGFTLYDARVDKKMKKKLLLRQALVNSLQRDMDGFDVHYQPLVDAKTERWVGMEALCRWKHPLLGKVSPNIFIAELEQLGLIGQLDQWVMESAVKQYARWGLAGSNITLDVNLSPTEELGEGYLGRLMKMLAKYNFPARQLCIEITESRKFNFNSFNLSAMQRMRRAGIHISLDDFGTGYSNLTSLARMPAGYLKTERSFISNVENDTHQQYLLRMLVNLTHTVEMKIVSEGVETPLQKELLMGYGVDLMQGYLFSRPLSSPQMEKKLSMFVAS